MASSSSSVRDSQCYPRWKYDVFLSFRGKDTRSAFTGHLYEGLKNRGIFTFKDDERLEEGDSISEGLVKGIEESQVAIIVFSKNYATSRWCLNELQKIIECKEKENGQIVIPIFYDVDPANVRYQSGSFAEAFAKHESRYKDDVEGMQKLQAWRTALTAAAGLKGYDIRKGIESEKVNQIVDHISSKYCKSARLDVVGINDHLEELKSRLQIEINDVRVLGICGMGGIGKTTMAKALFDTLSYQFKSACFLADVKEYAKKNELHSLQNTLLSELLRRRDNYVNNKHDGKSMIPRRLCSMKVLIVLDDIDHGDQLEYLAGDVGWFGNGSRVIVTTRDRHLIEKDVAIYEVPTLPDHEAMQLFNQHAFKREVPDERFKEISEEVVDRADGLPLALKVWGSLLHKKDLVQWRSTVDQIKKTPNSEIVEKLKISYDGLEPEEQDIFLDIACFFRGDDRTEVIQILVGCGFEAECGLGVLIDKSLLFISEDGRIEMHDLIEEVGKYIVKMQNKLGKPNRILNFEDFEYVMDNTGTMAVEAIWFYRSIEICVSVEAMKNMPRLRILSIETIKSSSSIDGSIECLPNNLCWFVWYKYPWKLLPQNFNPTRLVHLQLQHSSLHYLWNETKQLLSLRWLDLSLSESLKRTPDFSGMPNLEYLYLSECTSLEEVHHSLGCSRKLIVLNLSECKSLKRFPYVNVESLKSLYLMWNKFPEFIGRMKPELKIMMTFTGMREIPSSICKLKCLVKLNVSKCSKLANLPEEIGDLEYLEKLDASDTLISRPPSSIVRLNKLKELSFARDRSAYFVFPQVNKGLRSLEYLDLSGCNLTDGALPEDIGSLSSLKRLYLGENNFEHLPRSIAQLGALESLDLSDCKKLKELPCFTGMPNLDTVDLSFCNLTDGALPEDIGSLSSLKDLNLSGNNFEHLPRSIAQLGALQSLHLSGCKKLKELPCFTGMPNLKDLDLSRCNLTDGALQEDIGSLSSLKRLYLIGNNFEHLPRSIAQLGALESLYLSGCMKLKELPCFTGMPNLKDLDLSGCNLTDGALPEDFGSLSSLKRLHLRRNNFEHLPRSIAQLGALEYLYLSGSKKLKELPCFTGMPNLKDLDLSHCNLTDGALPEDIGSLSFLKYLNLSGNNFEHLPRSIAQLGALQSLDLLGCKKLKELPCFTGMPNLKDLDLSGCNLTDGALPEDIGSLSFLKDLNLSGNNFEHLPRSIAQLGALQSLHLSGCKKLKELPCFTGMPNLKDLDLSRCNLTDGALPEDIGSLSFLKDLNLSGNNFEHLPRSIAQLGALQSLHLSGCKKLKELPCFTGMPNLKDLDLSGCNLTDGALPEDIGSLSFLKDLNLSGNNFEHLPRSIAQLGALESLDLSGSKKLKELPEFPQQLDIINADWSNDWICNSLFQNISSLQHDISDSGSLSLRVFKSGMPDDNIPSWFHHKGISESVSVNLRENWYASDNFLGFAVCYSGMSIDEITAHLIPLYDDDGTSSMTQKFALSNHSEYGIHFCLVPLAGLWDASKANGKTPNDYGRFRLFSTGEMKKIGVRLLYKDEPELHRYEEACCCFPLLQLFPTRLGL